MKRQAKSINPSTYVGIETIVVSVFCRFMSWAITTNANMNGCVDPVEDVNVMGEPQHKRAS